MNFKDKVWTDAVLMTCSRSFYKAVSLLAVVFITRYFGPYMAGAYFFSFAFARMFGHAINAGLHRYFIREVSARTGQVSALLQDVVNIRALHALAVLAAGWLLAFALFPGMHKFCALAILSIILDETAYTFSSLFLAKGKVALNVAAGVSSRVVFLLVLYWAWVSRGGLMAVLIAHCAAGLSLLTINLLLTRRFITPLRMRMDFSRYGILIKIGAAFLFINIIGKFTTDIFSILLGYFNRLKEVGLFNAAFVICTAFLFIPEAVMAVLYPVLVARFKKQPERLLAIYNEYVTLFLLGGLAGGAILYAFSGFLVVRIFGQDYYGAITLTKILSLSVPFLCANLFNIGCLISLYRERSLIRLLSATAVFNIVSGWVMIAGFGATGASVALAVTQIFQFMALRQGIVNTANGMIPGEKGASLDRRRILVCRTDGIGDVVLATPVITALRSHYPAAYIAVLVDARIAPLLKGSPDIDEIIAVDNGREHNRAFKALKLAQQIKQKRFDLAVLLHAANEIRLITWFAGISQRIGYAGRWAFLLTDALPYTKFRGEKHEREYNLDLLRLIGIESYEKNTFVSITDIAEEKAGRILSEHNIAREDALVIIHPAASCVSKMWPTARFAELINRLIENYRVKVIVISAKEHIQIVGRLASAVKYPFLDLGGRLSLDETAALIRKSRLLISNDSGPIHVASALGTPVIAIFGRKHPRLGPGRWGPVGDTASVVQKDVGCVECRAPYCENNFACLQAVTVDDIMAKVAQVIRWPAFKIQETSGVA